MHTARSVVKDERGIAVVTALVALLALTALVLAFLAVSAYEPQISRNLADSTRARYVAEAGIEMAYDTLVTNTNWNNYLVGATCTQGAVLGGQNQTLPGLTAASGTYTVRVRNDCQAADNVLTGVTAEPVANATSDTNNHLILTSVGAFGSATRTISVVISRVPNLLSPTAPVGGQINAALAFPGVQSDTSFTGAAFTVDGRDYTLNDTLSNANPAVYGISVSSAYPTHEAQVEASLASSQKSDVTGKDQTNPGATTTGNNTVATDAGLNSQIVEDFVNAVKGVADINLHSSQPSGLSYNNIGNTCSTNINDANCWGTVANPKIVYIGGDYDPTSAFNALSIAGNSSGAGILIVDNGDFTMRGNFNWVGPVIVTGKYVGVGLLGGGNQEILGALISNEMASDEAPGFYEGVLQGNAKVKYSRAAIDNALSLLARKIPATGGGSFVSVTMYNFQEQ